MWNQDLVDSKLKRAPIDTCFSHGCSGKFSISGGHHLDKLGSATGYSVKYRQCRPERPTKSKRVCQAFQISIFLM